MRNGMPARKLPTLSKLFLAYPKQKRARSFVSELRSVEKAMKYARGRALCIPDRRSSPYDFVEFWDTQVIRDREKTDDHRVTRRRTARRIRRLEV